MKSRCDQKLSINRSNEYKHKQRFLRCFPPIESLSRGSSTVLHSLHTNSPSSKSKQSFPFPFANIASTKSSKASVLTPGTPTMRTNASIEVSIETEIMKQTSQITYSFSDSSAQYYNRCIPSPLQTLHPRAYRFFSASCTTPLSTTHQPRISPSPSALSDSPRYPHPSRTCIDAIPAHSDRSCTCDSAPSHDIAADAFPNAAAFSTPYTPALGSSG